MIGFNQNPLESIDVRPAFVPRNLASAANNGQWADCKGFEGVLAVVFKATGTAGQDPEITVRQANTATGGAAKALPFRRAAVKLSTSLARDVNWTINDQPENDNTYSRTDWGEREIITAIWIPTETMDTGFDWLQVSIADTGTGANVGCAFYMGFAPRYSGDELPTL